MLSFILIGLLMVGTFHAFPTADTSKQYVRPQISKYGFDDHSDFETPNFDAMDAVSDLMTKREHRKVDNLKKQQHRRGSFDSLLAGNGFGRNSKRSDGNLMIDPFNFIALPLSHSNNTEELPKLYREFVNALYRRVYGNCDHIKRVSTSAVHYDNFLPLGLGNEAKPSIASMKRNDNFMYRGGGNAFNVGGEGNAYNDGYGISGSAEGAFGATRGNMGHIVYEQPYSALFRRYKQTTAK